MFYIIKRNRVSLAREELTKWKEKCGWITETVRKKDTNDLMNGDRTCRRFKNVSLPKMELSSVSATTRSKISFKH